MIGNINSRKIECAKEILLKKLTDVSDDEVKRLLNRWLKRTSWGSDYEAERLIIFIQIWRETLRATRTDTLFIKKHAKKCGILERVEAHFSGLYEHKHYVSDLSLELIQFGFYGTIPGNSLDVNERINNQIVYDAGYIIKNNESPPISESSRIHNVDRKTIRSDRESNQYASGLKRTLDFMKFYINRKN